MIKSSQSSRRVTRYVPGTLPYGVLFRSSALKLLAFTNNDWAGSLEDSKSTSGYCFTLGSSFMCWSSRKRGSVAQSNKELKRKVQKEGEVELLHCLTDTNMLLIFLSKDFRRNDSKNLNVSRKRDEDCLPY
ncbi:hypothetical protein K1719_007674 [Acacia pycnantha]|nr:hypothetical protein K1719_007674 [Acacia pycnantha]